MLKFIQHHLDTITGISLYPVLSFLIFFSIFIFSLLYVRKASRQHVDRMSALPLADDPPPNESHDHARS